MMKPRSKKTLIEFTIWFAIFAMVGTVNTLTIMGDMDRFGVVYDSNRAIFFEITGVLSAFLLIPFVILWINKFPLSKVKWASSIATHIVGGLIYGLVHVGVMFLLRTIGLDFVGEVHTTPEGFNTYALYEIRKIFPLYVVFIFGITGYRYYWANIAKPKTSKTKSDKLLIKTRKGEELITRSKIDWLKAAANYVELHVGEREYLVRTTLSKLDAKLSDAEDNNTGGHFVRVHKSFIVNLDRIAEITPTESGDFRIKLTTGADIPLSRRYRENLDTVF